MVDVSVLMCIYNTEPKILLKAINSVLNQSFRNLELVLVDDASTYEETKNVIDEARKDLRVVVHKNKKNVGLTKALNIGLALCKGKYIARLDADDVAFESRIEEEYKFLEENSDISVVCSLAEYIGDKPERFQTFVNYMKDHEKFKLRMALMNVGPIHSTAMIRKKILDEYKICYDERYYRAQDYKLWMDLLDVNAKFACIEKKTIIYRFHDGQISKENGLEQNQCAFEIAKSHLVKVLGIDEKSACIMCSLYSDRFDYKKDEYVNAIDLCKKMNMSRRYFDIKSFDKEMKIRWIHKVLKCMAYGKDCSGAFCGYTIKVILYGGLVFWVKERLKYRQKNEN